MTRHLPRFRDPLARPHGWTPPETTLQALTDGLKRARLSEPLCPVEGCERHCVMGGRRCWEHHSPTGYRDGQPIR